jgi:hypothetical protein
MAAQDCAAPPLGAAQGDVADSEMRLGTLVTGIGGETQLLVDLAAAVGFVLAIFAIAFLLGFWCGRTRRRR